MKKVFYLIIGLIIMANVVLPLAIPHVTSAIPTSFEFYSSTSDGYMTKNGTNYTIVRESLTGTVYDTESMAYAGQRLHAGVYTIYRAALYFDTSSLPDNAIIGQVVLGLRGSFLPTTQATLRVVNGDDLNDPLETTDYSYLRNQITSYGECSWNEWTYGWNYIILNDAGEAKISKTGDTLFGLRTEQEIYYEYPRSDEIFSFYTSDIYTEFTPRLIVYYDTVLGSGTASDPYVITTVSELQAMNNDLDAYYELGNNIDASATSGWNGYQGFEPIGATSDFTGQLDGKGYTISSLFICRPASSHQGLFETIGSGAVVKNLVLLGMDITGNSGVGGLAAHINAATITGVVVNGTVENDASLAGMLASTISGNSTVSDCGVTGTVTNTGNSADIGGFAGYVDGTGLTISNCYSTVDVSASGADHVGGFIGYTGTCSIDVCYSTGDVYGHSMVGGFIGRGAGGDLNVTGITDCYARSNTRAVHDAAGFVNSNGDYATSDLNITNCYAAGTLTTDQVPPTGWLAGFFYDDNLGDVVVTSCFWDKDLSGVSTSLYGTGKTTAEMKTVATFTGAGWDFVATWGIVPAVNDGYPQFELVPTAPITFRITSINPTSISLAWLHGLGSPYTLMKYDTDEFPANTIAGHLGYDGVTTSCIVEGLISGTTYYFRTWGYLLPSYSYSDDYADAVATTSASILSSGFTPPSETPGTPDLSSHSGEFWYQPMSWLADAYNLSLGMFMRIFIMLLIALFSILIGYKSGNLLVTLIATITMTTLAYIYGIVPFWTIAVYGIIASSIAYVKGNAHA